MRVCGVWGRPLADEGLGSSRALGIQAHAATADARRYVLPAPPPAPPPVRPPARSTSPRLRACVRSQGNRLNDLGKGQPQVIIADIFATAAIVRAAQLASPDQFFHSSRLLLYLDEPNMGIHMDPQVRARTAVQRCSICTAGVGWQDRVQSGRRTAPGRADGPEVVDAGHGRARTAAGAGGFYSRQRRAGTAGTATPPVQRPRTACCPAPAWG